MRLTKRKSRLTAVHQLAQSSLESVRRMFVFFFFVFQEQQ